MQKELNEGRRFVLIGLVLVSIAVSLGYYFTNRKFFCAGPNFAVEEVARSIARLDGISPQYFTDVYQDAAALSLNTSSDVWQDVFSVSKDGRLVPKHSLLSAIVAAPFYFFFGDFGFWVLQQIFFIWLVYSVYLLVEELTGQPLPWSTLVATCVLTPTGTYLYAYGYDLHCCSLVIGGLYILRRRPTIGGAIMALSMFVRPSSLLLIFPLAIGGVRGGQRSEAMRAIYGLTVVLLMYAGLNYYLWGSPFIASYSRLPRFHNGIAVLSTHPIGFDPKILMTDWARKLYSPEGLLPYNLALIAFPWVLYSLLRDKNRFLAVCMITSISYSLYIFSYAMWDVTGVGNRFLLPVIYLYLLSFIPQLGRVELYFRRRRSHAS